MKAGFLLLGTTITTERYGRQIPISGCPIVGASPPEYCNAKASARGWEWLTILRCLLLRLASVGATVPLHQTAVFANTLCLMDLSLHCRPQVGVLATFHLKTMGPTHG